MGIFDTLNAYLLGRNTWPPRDQRVIWETIELWDAFRRSDEERIKLHANIPWHRRYLLSPIPRLISRANSNLLYGEPPEIKPANEADEEQMEHLASENGMTGDGAPELHRAAMITSSEGEVWGKVSVDPTLQDCPIVEFVSRRQVIPHFRGRFVVGATFVDEWEESYGVCYRLLETYEAGAVRAALYRGTRTTLGAEVSLDSYDKTEGKLPVVMTGFDYPLVAFIPNSIDADPGRGFSDYRGLEERFLSVNETATIGQENVRLAGKKRALLDAKYLRNGRLPAGDDLFIRAESEVTAGEGGKPLQMVEYKFEASELKLWLEATIDTTLNLGGIAPELVGRNVQGETRSGTALKLKMIHSLMEASGKGSYFDRGLRRLLRAAAVLDGRRTTEGGFGRKWTEPDADHSIQRGNGLPGDDMEAAQWLVLVSGANAISLEEKVRWIHPEWTPNQITEEIDRIRAQTPGPPAGIGDIPTPPPAVLPAGAGGSSGPANPGGQPGSGDIGAPVPGGVPGSAAPTAAPAAPTA